MKKMIVLLAVVVMSMSASAWAADAPANPKLEQAKELRGQALKAQVQADYLLKQAKALELEVLAAEKKPGEKMRGGIYFTCSGDCISEGHGDIYTCNRACGNY